MTLIESDGANICSGRIGMMTWFSYHNYGTVLQAYALQAVIRGLGYEPFLINYNPAPNASYQKNKRFASRALSSLYRRLFRSPYYETEERSDAFARFIKERLSVDEAEVVADVEFERLADAFDAFVCGSDQIWSPRYFDHRYFLSFVHTGKQRIAYAPSFGCENVGEYPVAGEIASLLSEFDYLSSRESSGCKIIESLCGKYAKHVLDPTLLLDKEDWLYEFHRGVGIGEGYCLCYFLGGLEKNWEKARMIARKLGLEIVAIPMSKKDYKRGCSFKNPVGPEDFISLFANASFVCTDSFHGLAFSALFGIDFAVFKRFSEWDPYSQNERILDFLRRIDCPDRLVDRSINEVLSCLTVDEWGQVGDRIRCAREDSIEYLRCALSNATS